MNNILTWCFQEGNFDAPMLVHPGSGRPASARMSFEEVQLRMTILKFTNCSGKITTLW